MLYGGIQEGEKVDYSTRSMYIKNNETITFVVSKCGCFTVLNDETMPWNLHNSHMPQHNGQ